MCNHMDRFLKPRATVAPSAKVPLPMPAGAPKVSLDAFVANLPPPAAPLEAFTDGACPNNGRHAKVAGAGVAFPERPELNVSERITSNPTNNRAELTAILRALEVADDTIDTARRRPIIIYTDSQLCIDSLTKWIGGWKKNGWLKRDKTAVLNDDLLKAVDARMQRRRVTFVHVRAHTGKQDRASILNALADDLATGACK